MYKTCKKFVVLFVLFGVSFFVQTDVSAATAMVDTSEVHQTMEGFGASVAWEVWQLYSHSEKGEIYNYLFKELGMDIIRLRSVYDRGEDYIFGLYEEIVDSFYSKSENDPKILISSWTPTTDLKSNDNLVGGTLDTTETGEYDYGGFAQYWMDVLDEFESVGIVPDYISIQNEPDWGESHATCRFNPTENSEYAGYDQALDSVYQRLQGLSSSPKILAPEVLGIGYNNFQNYASEFNHDHADGYAYHLYHGGEGNVDPDAFNSNLSAIAGSYTDKPIFQTEYDIGDWFNTGWLIHNCLVRGNVSGYLYWASVWNPAGKPLITLDGSSYTINREYWAFRQYAKAIHYGWKRVGASVDGDSVRISAYIAPENNDLSIVVINIGHSDEDLDLDIPGFDISGANILRTSEEEKCDYIGDYNGSTIDLPARSITTISTLYIDDVSGIEEENYDSPAVLSLSQNCPSPFSTSTTIEYSIADEGFVNLSIYDVTGRELQSLVNEIKPAGTHTVDFNSKGLPQGVYIYRLEMGGNSVQNKMLLLK